MNWMELIQFAIAAKVIGVVLIAYSAFQIFFVSNR